jgi:4-hydroxy-3-methylbut-2-en-1-yl diphosphate reductase
LGIEVIDATCPVVLKLQQRVKKAWEAMKPINGQVVIYGKKNHPEVIGLLGQTNNEAIIGGDGRRPFVHRPNSPH